MTTVKDCIYYMKKVNRPVPIRELKQNLGRGHTTDSIYKCILPYIKSGDIVKVPYKDKNRKAVRMAYQYVSTPTRLERPAILETCIDAMKKNRNRQTEFTVNDLIRMTDYKETAIRGALRKGCEMGLLRKTKETSPNLHYTYGLRIKIPDHSD